MMEQKKNIPGVMIAADMQSCLWADMPSGADQHFSPEAFTRGCHELIADTLDDQIACSGLATAILRAILADMPHALALWVTHARHEKHHGRLSGRGMVSLGLDPSRVIFSRARRCIDALWAAEEAARSAAVAAVIAESDQADFTMTRRLALASERHGTPILLLLPPGHGGASASRSRWSLRCRPSSHDAYDRSAPGSPSWRLRLERAKRFPYAPGYQKEITHETHRLDSSVPVVAGQAVSVLCRAGS